MPIKQVKWIFFLAVLFFSCVSTPIFAEDEDDAPTIKTVLTDQLSPSPIAKDVFNKNTPMIYIIWHGENFHEKQKLKSIWIADDTKHVAPDHYKIDEASLDIKKGEGEATEDNEDEAWDGKFNINKPNNGWPLGKYHVDIYLDNKLLKTVNFSVQ